MNLELHIRELEEKVKHLEERIEMLASIADFEKHPFIFTALEYRLSRGDVKKIYGLMEFYRKRISDGVTITHSEFERELYKEIPSLKGNFLFAKSIVMTLNDEKLYTEVYEELKKSGMNI